MGIVSTIQDQVSDLFSGAATALMEIGCGAYSSLASKARGFLVMTPKEFNPDAWAAVKAINTAFIATGTSLVAFFFLMGMYSELQDSKMDVKMESVLFDFLKLLIAEYLVTNSFTLVSKFMTTISDLGTKAAGDEFKLDIVMNDDIYTKLDNVSWGGALVVCIVAVFFIFLMTACGIAILLAAFKRFLKLMALVPYGCIASSTFAGSHVVRASAVSFWKFALSTMLESVTMLILLRIFAAWFGAGDLQLFDSIKVSSAVDKNCSDLVFFMIEKTLVAFTCAGTISASDTITQRALGL